MAPAAAQPVQHRSTAKHSHKPFKSRHATKGQVKDLLKGKIESERGKRNRKPLHQQVMSKIERRNQARQHRQNKQREHAHATSVFAGRNGAPRIVTIVPLSRYVDTAHAIQVLSRSLDVEADVQPDSPTVHIQIDRFKQHVRFVRANGALFDSLDACRVADYNILLLDPVNEVDEQSIELLKTIESQGVSNVLTMVQGIEKLTAKRRPQVLNSLKSFITQFFPEQEKISSLDSLPECSNMMRSICTSTPKGIHWREDRSWMLVDDIQWESGDSEHSNTAILTGVVRGQPMKANRLLQVSDWGEFQIHKIVTTRSEGSNLKGPDAAMDSEENEVVPDTDQDTLEELAPDDIAMDDSATDGMVDPLEPRKGVLLDDHHYFSEGEDQQSLRPRRLPKGTSEYQAAWYLDDISDSGSDVEELDGNDDKADQSAPRPEDGMEGLDQNGAPEPTEAGPSEYPQSEAYMDVSADEDAAELAAYRASRRKDAAEDAEFPDEIELDPNAVARERLARYRGLKSLRTSRWEAAEDRPHEPSDWNRLLQVPNYAGTRSAALREALVGGVPAGTKVQVYVRDVPTSVREQDALRPALHPLTAFSLLRHEHKRTVMHYAITLRGEQEEPLPSKAEVVLQCGPRRFIAHPIFSAPGTTPNDVHKFDRYLHPGRTAIASVMAPLTWGAVPTLVFARGNSNNGDNGDIDEQEQDASSPTTQPLTLIGTGTALPPSSKRVVAKRIVLTGHPYRINRRIVTIRYMFFNPEDVRWFAALPLWTRRGRAGYIKEPLGTHGHFKATFDGRINAQDAVGVSLYKRVWPRPARRWDVNDLNKERALRDGIEREAREEEAGRMAVE